MLATSTIGAGDFYVPATSRSSKPMIRVAFSIICSEKNLHVTFVKRMQGGRIASPPSRNSALFYRIVNRSISRFEEVSVTND